MLCGKCRANSPLETCFDRRLGAIVSLVNYDDKGCNRSILYQSALSEIFVPYMDATETWYYRTYMAGSMDLGY